MNELGACPSVEEPGTRNVKEARLERRSPRRGQSAAQVVNLTREQTLVTKGRLANSFWSRFRGLMGNDGLQAGEGLLIVPCNSIHTHFMRFPIDVLYVGSDCEVVGIDHALRPWRFGRIHRGARFVLELPAGTAKATNTQVGDRLEVTGCSLTRS